MTERGTWVLQTLSQEESQLDSRGPGEARRFLTVFQAKGQEEPICSDTQDSYSASKQGSARLVGLHMPTSPVPSPVLPCPSSHLRISTCPQPARASGQQGSRGQPSKARWMGASLCSRMLVRAARSVWVSRKLWKGRW